MKRIMLKAAEWLAVIFVAFLLFKVSANIHSPFAASGNKNLPDFIPEGSSKNIAYHTFDSLLFGSKPIVSEKSPKGLPDTFIFFKKNASGEVIRIGAMTNQISGRSFLDIAVFDSADVGSSI